MQFLTKSIQRELDAFFKKLSNSDLDIRTVTKGAFTQARSKLDPNVFKEIDSKNLTIFYNEAPYQKWLGHRLIACDGTTVVLPKHKSVAEKFPITQFGPKANSKQSVARVSLVYDVLNQVTLHGKLGAYTEHETTLFKEQLPELPLLDNDVLLLDRGYPSFGLLFRLQAMGLKFCIRLKDNWWNAVNEMIAHNETDKIVTLQLSKKDKHLLDEYEWQDDKITIRVSVIVLENGTKEILCTNFFDKEKYTLEVLKSLYNMRWGIEEHYKLLKTRVQLEAFSGKTLLSVEQDFFANIFLMNVAAMFYLPVAEKLKQEQKNTKNKWKKQLNKTSALSYIENLLPIICLTDRVKRLFKKIDDFLIKTTEIIRPGRKFERKHKVKKPKNQVYKDL